MLATIFDFPFEERHLLTYWSDLAIATPELTGNDGVSDEERSRSLGECLQKFTALWHERKDQPPKFDLISMLITELGGKQIKKGDKLLMWYVSGNRDESMIDRANEFIIDRPSARHHLSFGFGIHRCMGNRLAEMQLRIVWEEIMKRFSRVEVVAAPTRGRSNFVRGIIELPVRLHAL